MTYFTLNSEKIMKTYSFPNEHESMFFFLAAPLAAPGGSQIFGSSQIWLPPGAARFLGAAKSGCPHMKQNDPTSETLASEQHSQTAVEALFSPSFAERQKCLAQSVSGRPFDGILYTEGLLLFHRSFNYSKVIMIL